MRRLCLLPVLLAMLVATSAAAEVGLRARWDDRAASCSGWLRGSAEVAGVRISGNANLDLLRVSLEGLAVSARHPWSWGEAMVSGNWHAARGLSAAGSLSASRSWDFGAFTGTGGLEGRLHWSPARWNAYGAVDLTARLPWAWGWGEVRLEGALPWTGPRFALELSAEGEGRLTALLSATEAGPSSASLEFAATQGAWRISSALSSPPVRQSVTVAWQGARGRWQGRGTIRRGGPPTWDLRSSARIGVLNASAGIDGEGGGMRSLWVELRFALP